jgi:hypothetical protein
MALGCAHLMAPSHGFRDAGRGAPTRWITEYERHRVLQTLNLVFRVKVHQLIGLRNDLGTLTRNLDCGTVAGSHGDAHSNWQPSHKLLRLLDR